MRTTINIDEDVLNAVRELARTERRSAGAVISDLARAGLRGDGTRRIGEVEVRDGFPLLPSRGGIVTNQLIDEIRESEGI